MEHGSGRASIGNATVRLPHCSQTSLNVWHPVRVTLVSISMSNLSIRTAMIAQLKNAQVKTHQKPAPTPPRLKIPVPVASCNA
jgi:hypothetical protein